ncbi:uncharacterized protein LOC122306335 [Carya illinoinensis]|uniref:uncharacterized protein LOC122306335 n=1 Tax=Carya illinoinensis TaxID=32201 RepID=UPI001C71DEC4|nr:uncharacterized protein LOC122306335 [Carya illinoinensis]
MGFDDKWINLTTLYVKTVSFSILVNGELKGPVFPTQGLRQGDLISPYLFPSCTEGLIALLTTLQTSLNIQYLLEIYEQASGQKVSQEKTSMVFSKNVPHSQEEEIMDFWGIQHYHQYEKHLRLPPMVGKRKKKTFSDLKHKVWTELKGWKAKLLSQGDKEVLIKAMALSIPTYTMSCFKLPSTLCYELENLMAKFWWDQKKDENKMQWSNAAVGQENVFVASLIDANTKWWNVDKEGKVFLTPRQEMEEAFLFAFAFDLKNN